MTEEILVVKKKFDKMKFKVTDRRTNQWSPSKYENVIAGRNPELLANLLYDLDRMGYPIEKAFEKFKRMLNEPELFFLK